MYITCDSHKVECTEQGFNYYLYLNNHKGFRKGESLGKPKLKTLVRKKIIILLNNFLRAILSIISSALLFSAFFFNTYELLPLIFLPRR